MNADELMERMDRLIGANEKLLVETAALHVKVEALQVTVNRLEQRLTYRERMLVGWKEISQYVGLSVSQAHIRGNESFDPLPVVREGSQVIASAHAIDAWKMRERAGYRRVLRVSVQESTETPS